MRITHLYHNLSIRAAGLGASIKQQFTAARVFGLWLLLFSPLASAKKVADLLTGWQEGANAAISFAVVACLLIGLCGVAYGCKLIMDKSNDRADVKNSHIMVSLLGGSLLCVIWFVIEVLVNTSGGDSSGIKR